MLVVGAGSIGTRHARNLKSAGASVSLTDLDPARGQGLDDVARVPFDLERVAEYDGVVIASPTRFHRDQALTVLDRRVPVLVEKPMAMETDDLGELEAAAGGRLMVGFNLRLHEPVERFMELVHGGRCGPLTAVRVWFGSYLPDWRPAVDYRDTYSARAALGGGILLDAIHELDLLVWLVGEGLTVVGSVVDRLGALDIDVEDTAKALLRRDGIVVEVSLDYLSRAYRRGIEAIGERATVRLDWARGVIEIEDRAAREVIDAGLSLDRSYERQADRFLEFIAGTAPPPVDAHVGAASVRLARQIREAAG